jgi:hypothetical protein
VAWQKGDTAFDAEIVSVTNEEEQLRLGLGQMLCYRHCLQRTATRKSSPSWFQSIRLAIPPWTDLRWDLQVVLLHGHNLDQAAPLP